MRLTKAFLFAALLCLPLNVYGQQIAPNPNPSGHTITLDDVGVNHEIFHNYGTVDIVESIQGEYLGMLTNHGTLTTDYTLLNNGMLTNNGTLTNNRTLNNEHGATLNNHGTLTNNHTLSQSGTLTNHGELNISSHYNIERWEIHGIGSNAVLRHNSGTLNNHGTMNVHEFGMLRVAAGSIFDNTNGTLNINESSTIESHVDNFYQALQDGLGGTVHLAPETSKHGHTTSVGMNYNNYAHETIAANKTLHIAENWVNGSGVEPAGIGAGLPFTVTENGTLTNHGTLSTSTLAALINNDTLINEHGATLINHAGDPNPQPGNPSPMGGMANHYTMTNHGTLTNHGLLSFGAGSSFDNTGGTLENHGIIYGVVNNYYQTLKHGLGGTVRFESGSAYTNSINEIIAAGTSLVLEDASGGHNHTFTNNFILWVHGGELYNKGTLNNGTTVPGPGPGEPRIITNRARIDVDHGSTLNNGHGATLNNRNGSTLNNHGDLWNSTGATLNNEHGATLNNEHGATVQQNSNVYNSGTINNNGSWSGTLNNEHGATLNNHGQFYGDINNHGTITGSGHYQGTINDHGHMHPGHSPGVVTIDGNYYKRAGSKEIELGGHFHGGGDKSLTEFDWLDVTGNVELAGALNVYLTDSFELLAGMSFEILNVGGTLTGQYDGLGEGALVGNFGGEDLFITYTAGSGNDVALYTVPEPTTLLLTLLALVAAPLRVRCG